MSELNEPWDEAMEEIRKLKEAVEIGNEWKDKRKAELAEWKENYQTMLDANGELQRELAAEKRERQRTVATAASLQERLAAAERALNDIASGNISPDNGGPEIESLSPDDFRHAMWTWSQKIAREALAQAQEGEHE